MKRIYIKPETERLSCRITPLLDGSNNTEWHTGTEGEGDDNPIGGDQPDPNSDDAKSWAFDLWE